MTKKNEVKTIKTGSVKLTLPDNETVGRLPDIKGAFGEGGKIDFSIDGISLESEELINALTEYIDKSLNGADEICADEEIDKTLEIIKNLYPTVLKNKGRKSNGGRPKGAKNINYIIPQTIKYLSTKCTTSFLSATYTAGSKKFSGRDLFVLNVLADMVDDALAETQDTTFKDMHEQICAADNAAELARKKGNYKARAILAKPDKEDKPYTISFSNEMFNALVKRLYGEGAKTETRIMTADTLARLSGLVDITIPLENGHSRSIGAYLMTAGVTKDFDEAKHITGVKLNYIAFNKLFFLLRRKNYTRIKNVERDAAFLGLKGGETAYRFLQVVRAKADVRAQALQHDGFFEMYITPTQYCAQDLKKNKMAKARTVKAIDETREQIEAILADEASTEKAPVTCKIVKGFADIYAVKIARKSEM